MISACHPFLKINTINKFIQYYIDLNLSGFFGVTGQRNYYWNNDGQLLNKWPEEQDLLNTKAVEPTYEAAHCLYASKMESIKNGQWVGDWKTGKNINFCNINEFEALDIDYQWQFDLYNEYFKKIENEMLQ
jgi:CMP-N-acetylneuraminic acid synthetase